MIGRFAPSTTGEAHPGTLLSALLVWLDARAQRGRALLRLEDLDPARTRAAWSEQMIEALAWLGLDWDAVTIQSGERGAHEAALDQLADAGRLYPCACSRAARTRPAPDGGFAYDNTCRDRPLPDWRASSEPLRVKLPADRIELVDDNGVDLSQTPALDMGDPIVRRRDGAIAYQLAVVVDDAAQDVTSIVRGADLLASTPRQIHLQHALGLPTPSYLHVPVAIDASGEKLSKQTHARALPDDPLPALVDAWRFLEQPPLDAATLSEFWSRAIAAWSPARLPPVKMLPAPRSAYHV